MLNAPISIEQYTLLFAIYAGVTLSRFQLPMDTRWLKFEFRAKVAPNLAISQLSARRSHDVSRRSHDVSRRSRDGTRWSHDDTRCGHAVRCFSEEVYPKDTRISHDGYTTSYWTSECHTMITRCAVPEERRRGYVTWPCLSRAFVILWHHQSSSHFHPKRPVLTQIKRLVMRRLIRVHNVRYSWLKICNIWKKIKNKKSTIF